TPVGGAGSFSPATVTVGEDALAASTWTLGTVTGEQKAMVSVGALSEEITALAQPGAPFLVVKVAGDGASRVVGNTLTLEVEIQDEHTNVISNTPVTFAIAPGTTDATFVANDDVTFATTTDANGTATADLSVGTVATTFQVSVTAGDASE